MSKDSTREERLAAKLRENLKRRKSQARSQTSAEATATDPSQNLSKPAEEG